MKVYHIVPHPERSRDALTQFAQMLVRTMPACKSTVGEWCTLDPSHEGVVVLHYSPFGFSRYGAPLQLLRRLRKLHSPLVVVFHELSPDLSGGVWSAVRRRAQDCAVWWLTCRAQKCITTTQLFAERLAALNPFVQDRITVIPLASSLPEVAEVAVPMEREVAAVVFGTGGRRQAVYDRHPVFPHRCMDVGTGRTSVPPSCQSLGELTDEDLGGLLCRTRFGYLEYPESVLAKSSIFAAYLHYGCIPVVLGREGSSPRDGLQRRVHYILPEDRETLSGQELFRIQQEGAQWYSLHSAARWGESLEKIAKCAHEAIPRVVSILSHPTQNQRPFRLLEERKKINHLVHFCVEGSTLTTHGDEWLNQGVFKARPEQGYRTSVVRSAAGTLGRFFGLSCAGIFKVIAAADVVVVFGHNYWALIVAQICARMMGKALIVTTDANSLGDDPIRKRLKRILLPIYYNRCVDGVFIPSSVTREFLSSIRVAPSQLHITPYCSDEERFTPKSLCMECDLPDELRNQSFKILFVGKLIERKGVVDLLEAFQRSGLSQATLVLIGDGPLRDTVVKEIEMRSSKERSIVLKGFVPYDELSRWYQGVDVLVHPAHKEPWGLPVNEAMMHETPAVTSQAVGASKDLIVHGETGWVYPVGDVVMLAKLLKQLEDDRAHIQIIGTKARERVLAFGSHANAEAVERAALQVWRSRNEMTASR